jgi:hypothetical protein
MTFKRRGQATGPTGGVPPPIDPTQFLIERATEVERADRKKFEIKLHFKIRHIMWLSLWTALVLAAKDPLIASLPELATVIAWISIALAVAMFLSLFGVALLMDEGETKDRVVLYLGYCLAGDSLLALCLGFVVFDFRQ